MVFDFEGRLYDTPTVESAMSWRERLLLSVLVHALALALLFVVPRLPFMEAAAERRAERLAERVAEQLRLQEEQPELALAMPSALEDNPTFVFVQPFVDTPADAPPERAELSDIDRVSQSPEQAESPVNNLPNADGNTFEYVLAEEIGDTLQPAGAPGAEEPERAPELDAEPAPAGPDVVDPVDPVEPVEGVEEGPDTGVDERADPVSGTGDPGASDDPPSDSDALTNPFAPARPESDAARDEGAGSEAGATSRSVRERTESLLRQAMRPDRRLSLSRSFHNFGGRTNNTGPDIQFDTKGVEFGPWVRRFVAQIYRNWFVPYAAMTMSGHVVLTFNVHKDGTLTDLTVQRPSGVDAFTNSAFNALRQSDPTFPLPEEYPDDQAFFTVTFYFNERPPGR